MHKHTHTYTHARTHTHTHMMRKASREHALAFLLVFFFFTPKTAGQSRQNSNSKCIRLERSGFLLTHAMNQAVHP